MSSFIMNTKSLATLACCISKVHNTNYAYLGFSEPYSLSVELQPLTRDNFGFSRDSDIFALLYRINAEAVNGRYKDANEPTELPAFDFPTNADIMKPVQYISGYVVEPWHYQLVKLLDCWLYQTHEDATYRNPFRLAVKDLRDTLLGFIVRNCKHYDMAPWG